MENASKALIIAGAILIAIVLITLGVVLLQQGQGVSDSGETALTAREIETFNAQFTRFEGTNVRGTNVKQLYNTVTATNAASNGRTVKLYKGDTGTTALKSSDISTGSNYTVSLTYGTSGADNGYITVIRVK